MLKQDVVSNSIHLLTSEVFPTVTSPTNMTLLMLKLDVMYLAASRVVVEKCGCLYGVAVSRNGRGNVKILLSIWVSLPSLYINGRFAIVVRTILMVNVDHNF
jgi:hypothetical protein